MAIRRIEDDYPKRNHILPAASRIHNVLYAQPAILLTAGPVPSADYWDQACSSRARCTER